MQRESKKEKRLEGRHVRKPISICLMLIIITSLVLTGVPVYAIGEEGSVIAAGWNTTFFIKDDGALYGFGSNDKTYPLIDSVNLNDIKEPVKILEDVKSVCVNRSAVLVIKTDGSLWGWGNLPGIGKSNTPQKIKDGVISASLNSYGNDSFLVATQDGKLYLSTSNSTFKEIPHDKKVKFVSNPSYRKYFINEDNELWGFSTKKNGDLNLGVGHGDPVLEPVKIMEDVQYVTGDTVNTMVIKLDGSLWMWGTDNGVGFYDGTKIIKENVLSPIKIMEDVAHAAAYDSAFAVVKKDNTLWIWGDNNYDSNTHNEMPVKIDEHVNAVSFGHSHLIIAKTDNTLHTGGLGDGVYGVSGGRRSAFVLASTHLKDVPATWAAVEVREAEYRQLVPPALQSDYTKIVTRSEFCTLAITCIEQIHQMSVEDYLVSIGKEIPMTSPFVDINGLSERAQADIRAAYTLNIVSGTSETTFDPDSQITREQAATMLTATAAAQGDSTQAVFPMFSDSELVSNWAKPFLGYVYDAKIMSGVGNNRFDPKGGYQRQQAYITMLRLYKHILSLSGR